MTNLSVVGRKNSMSLGGTKTVSKSRLPNGVKCPVVTIDPFEEAKIKEWVRLCDKEISGLGKVVIGDDGSLHVKSVYLLEQEVDDTETEMDGDAVATLLFETREDEGAMIFWWHSHVEMKVFWSSTDTDTIYQFGSKGTLLSAVYNKKGERRVSWYVHESDYHPSVFLDDIDMTATTVLSQEQLDYCSKEFEEKVTVRPDYFAGPSRYWTDGYYDDDALLLTNKEIKDPAPKPKIINYTDKVMKDWGVQPHLIESQKSYFQLILTKWHDLSIPDRKEWESLYFSWHNHYTKPKKQLPSEMKAEYAEFADSFNFDLIEAERYCK